MSDDHAPHASSSPLPPVPPPTTGFGPGGFAAAPAPTPTSAAISLALGIASVLCLGFLAGIPAMVLARRATREIDDARGALGGRGVATAGFVTGLVGSILGVLVVVGLVGVVALGNGLQDRLEREACTSYGSTADC